MGRWTRAYYCPNPRENVSVYLAKHRPLDSAVVWQSQEMMLCTATEIKPISSHLHSRRCPTACLTSTWLVSPRQCVLCRTDALMCHSRIIAHTAWTGERLGRAGYGRGAGVSPNMTSMAIKAALWHARQTRPCFVQTPSARPTTATACSLREPDDAPEKFGAPLQTMRRSAHDSRLAALCVLSGGIREGGGLDAGSSWYCACVWTRQARVAQQYGVLPPRPHAHAQHGAQFAVRRG